MECLREDLYKLIETGDSDKILNLSQELDKLILRFMEMQVMNKISKI